MMEALRKGAQTWIAKILLGIVMATFGIIGVSSMDISATVKGLFPQDLATVGGEALSGEVYRQEMNRTLQQFMKQTGGSVTLEDARKLGLDKQVLDRMIAEAALDAQTERLGLAVGDQAVAFQVQAEPVFKDASGNFDVNRFRSLLAQNGLTEQGYIENRRIELTREAVSQTSGDNITLPRTLLDALTRYRDEQRDARYVSFKVNEADVPAPTADDLKKQYDASPAAYTAPEYRSIAVLKVYPADVAQKIQVSEQEISDAYNTFKEEYFEPETRDIIQLSFPDVAAAEKAKARIAAGMDIMKLAEELGQKPNDITFNGMRLDGFLDAKIGEAAFALKEGEVSAAIAGSLNTALLKAVKVKPAHQPTLAEIKPTITTRVQMQRAQDEIQSIYDAVEEARGNDVKFEAIAEKAGLALQVVPAVSQSGSDKAGKPVDLPAPDQLLKSVFASDVGVQEDAISHENGYVWYDVREVIPSALRPFDEVKDQVTQDWKAARLRTLAADKAKAIVEKAAAGSKLESIATELGGTVKTASGIKRNTVSDSFDGVATLALFSVPEKSLTWSLEGDGKSARIIEVAKVTLPTNSLAAGGQDVGKLARQGLKGDLLDSYMKATRSGTTVEINEELWRQISGTANTQ